MTWLDILKLLAVILIVLMVAGLITEWIVHRKRKNGRK